MAKVHGHVSGYLVIKTALAGACTDTIKREKENRKKKEEQKVIVVITTVIISMAVSFIVAGIVTLLGLYGYKCYNEKEINRILDEEGVRTEEHILEIIKQAKESIRNAHFDK